MLNFYFLKINVVTYSRHLIQIFSPRYSYSTIFALSSGHGKCGVAVIRISGPGSKDVLTSIAGFKSLPEPRKAILRKFRDPVSKIVLDHGLVLWFPGPRSFTGEDCCELHVHGGQAVISSLLCSLSGLKNFRPALPGEFTKRAFYGGKLDLIEVEGLADLINSETEAQRRQALQQMEGALSKIYSSWRDILTKCVANVEAYIDFSEEENIEDGVLVETHKTLKEILLSVQKHLVDGRRERLREGVKTVILGAPNVGKSSLLNLLSRRDTAIVSSIAGTTRDIISSTLDINGFPLVVMDTAGLRHFKENSLNSDIVEKEGISRAMSQASKADLIILVLDASTVTPEMLNGHFSSFITGHVNELGVQHIIYKCRNLRQMFKTNQKYQEADIRCVIVINKVDLINIKCLPEIYKDKVCLLSCKTEEGLDHLMDLITSHVEYLCGRPGEEAACWSQARHRHCLQSLVDSLQMALSTQETDLSAHHLRQALYHLASITGHISTEDILDVIFKNFCIGK